MGTKEVKIRLPDDLHFKLKEVADKQNRSITEIVKQLVIAYLSGSHPDEDIPVKIRVIQNYRLKYSDTCSGCGGEIKAGGFANIVIYEYEDGRTRKEYWHPWCWKYSNDETLVRLYIKRRELEKIVRALKKKADKLSDLIIEAEARKKVIDVAMEIRRKAEEIERRMIDIEKKIDGYLFRVYDKDKSELAEIKKEIRGFMNKTLDEIYDMSRELEEVASAFVSVKKKKTSRREEEEVEIWR